MTEDARRLLELAMQLSREERVEVAAKLVESVHAFTAAAAAWAGLIEGRARRALAGRSRGAARGFLRSPVSLDLEAEVDLEQAATWYEYNAPEHLAPFLDAVAEAIERVRKAPGAFGRHTALPDSLGVRRIFLRDFPYTMAYLSLEGELLVLAIAHQYRLPEQEDITVTALVEVEDWLTANGLRAIALLAAATLAH